MRSFTAANAAMIMGGVVLLAGCPSSMTFEDGGTDAGRTDSGAPIVMDSGSGTPDAGPGTADAGPGTTDAGPGVIDAGPGTTDAGPGVTDAGPGDAGDPCAGLDCTSFDGLCLAGMCSGGTCMAMPVTGGACVDDLCSWGDSCTAGACGGGTIHDCGASSIDVPTVDTTLTIGGTGGGVFIDDCPPGQVPIGVEGRVSSGFYNDILHQVATHCGLLSVSGSAVLTSPGVRIPASGGHGGWTVGDSATNADCPADQIVVGVAGATADGFMSQITLRCAPITLTGDASIGFGVSTGAITEVTLGTRVVTAIPAQDCPGGELARGFTGRNGEVLDGFGLRCGAPDFAIVTSGPPEAGVGGGRVNDDCPPGQVPVGFTAARASSSTAYNGVLTEGFLTCGTLVVTDDGSGSPTTTITAGDRVPATGARGLPSTNADMTATCPTDEAMVGFHGTHRSTSERYLNQLTLRCAPVLVTGDAATGYAVSYGTITETATVGTTVGTAFGPDDCPDGTLASGIRYATGQVIDGVSLRCAQPLIVPVAP